MVKLELKKTTIANFIGYPLTIYFTEICKIKTFTKCQILIWTEMDIVTHFQPVSTQTSDAMSV